MFFEEPLKNPAVGGAFTFNNRSLFLETISRYVYPAFKDQIYHLKISTICVSTCY